jgi:Xaa-Pro aminopeptidase
MATEVLPDDRALRRGRRERALAQMEADDLDILVLGRQANVRYVTGVPQLWVAGTRPFGPNCLLVRDTGAVHLLSTWDEGVPEEIPHENLYGICWNPLNTIANLQRIDAAARARRVGSDALSPSYARLLPLAFPNADLVDGEPTIQTARRVKTPEEIAALRESTRVAEVGLAAALAELRPGVTERTLTAVILESMTAGGVSSPASQDVAWITSKDHPWRRVAGDGVVEAGDLVALAPGVLAHGYIGELGRTYQVGDESAGARALFARAGALWDRLVQACRPGSRASELLAAYRAAGEKLPPMPVAHGVGVGFDAPVVSPQLPATSAGEVLEPGMVLAVTGYVWEHGVGAVLTRKTVHITGDGPNVLGSPDA